MDVTWKLHEITDLTIDWFSMVFPGLCLLVGGRRHDLDLLEIWIVNDCDVIDFVRCSMIDSFFNHDLHGSIHRSWCRVSSSNSMFVYVVINLLICCSRILANGRYSTLLLFLCLGNTSHRNQPMRFPWHESSIQQNPACPQTMWGAATFNSTLRIDPWEGKTKGVSTIVRCFCRGNVPRAFVFFPKSKKSVKKTRVSEEGKKK